MAKKIEQLSDDQKVFDETRENLLGRNKQFLHQLNEAGVIDLVCQFVTDTSRYHKEEKEEEPRDLNSLIFVATRELNLSAQERCDLYCDKNLYRYESYDQRAEVETQAGGAVLKIKFDKHEYRGSWSKGAVFYRKMCRLSGHGVQLWREAWKEVEVRLVSDETIPLIDSRKLDYVEIPQPPRKVTKKKDGLAGILGGVEQILEQVEPVKQVVLGLFINGKLVGRDGSLQDLWFDALNNPFTKNEDNKEEFNRDHYGFPEN